MLDVSLVCPCQSYIHHLIIIFTRHTLGSMHLFSQQATEHGNIQRKNNQIISLENFSYTAYKKTNKQYWTRSMSRILWNMICDNTDCYELDRQSTKLTWPQLSDFFLEEMMAGHVKQKGDLRSIWFWPGFKSKVCGLVHVVIKFHIKMRINILFSICAWVKWWFNDWAP